jgi:hypothetical protein
MESDRRKYKRKECGFIVDYQHIDEESDALARRASLVNVSAVGLCIHSSFMEPKDGVLLLSFPYVTPNPGVIAAKVKHVAAVRSGYIHGLFVLPLFHDRFTAIDSTESRSETIELFVAPREKAFIDSLGKQDRESAVVDEHPDEKTIEGICRLFVNLNPRIDESIGSLDELTEFFKHTIEGGERRGK